MKYSFATALYLLSILAHKYNFIIDRGIGSPVYGREVVDGLNTTDKSFLPMLTTTVKLNCAEGYYKNMAIHTPDVKKYKNL